MRKGFKNTDTQKRNHKQGINLIESNDKKDVKPEKNNINRATHSMVKTGQKKTLRYKINRNRSNNRLMQQTS